MMTGLGLLKLFGYYLQRRGDQRFNSDLAEIQMGDQELTAHYEPSDYGNTQYDIYKNLQKAEWDTLVEENRDARVQKLRDEVTSLKAEIADPANKSELDYIHDCETDIKGIQDLLKEIKILD